MRTADAATLLRIPILLLTAYAIAIRFNALAVLFLLLVLFASDAADGYLARLGRHSVTDFASYLLEEAGLLKKKERKLPKKTPAYAAYLDIAVDRLIEYALWFTFVALLVTPWFVFVIIFARNMIVDILMVCKHKTFSKMSTAFGKIASSHLSRGAYAALKALNFGYLSLVVVLDWPLAIGYLLTALVVAFSLLRGAAESYETLVG